MMDPEGRDGPDPSLLENNKAILFISNIGPDQKSQSYQASIQCRTIIGQPAKSYLYGALLMDH